MGFWNKHIVEGALLLDWLQCRMTKTCIKMISSLTMYIQWGKGTPSRWELLKIGKLETDFFKSASIVQFTAALNIPWKTWYMMLISVFQKDRTVSASHPFFCNLEQRMLGKNNEVVIWCCRTSVSSQTSSHCRLGKRCPNYWNSFHDNVEID